jgi:uncharacterized repeat protein (TIGR03833 family)
MELHYMTGGGKKKRYFKITKNKTKNGKISAKVSRISCQKYDDPQKNTNIGRIMPQVGDKVTIIIKPYYQYNCKTGIVQDVLTRKPIHTRGHKVRLTTGEIGRTLKII